MLNSLSLYGLCILTHWPKNYYSKKRRKTMWNAFIMQKAWLIILLSLTLKSLLQEWLFYYALFDWNKNCYVSLNILSLFITSCYKLSINVRNKRSVQCHICIFLFMWPIIQTETAYRPSLSGRKQGQYPVQHPRNIHALPVFTVPHIFLSFRALHC